MDDLVEPSMSKMPSILQMGDESESQLETGEANDAGGDHARKSSFEEDDKSLLGFTLEKKKFSYGASAALTNAKKSQKEILDPRQGEIHSSVPRVHLSAKQKKDIAQAFEVFDVGGTGYMSAVDLRVALRALGFDAKKHEMKRLLEISDQGSTGRLCYADFMTIIEIKLGEDDTKDDILKAFNLFDKDQVGFISFHNLQQVAHELGEDVNDEEIAEMLAEADLDDDGTVNQEEFFKILKKTSLI